ncbi:MAG TPA: tetratricopeptide repeat protein [Acidobacteriota bacterium]|nr:tetratricopeptide repeat protein [Acidobacteriota bacterium]
MAVCLIALTAALAGGGCVYFNTYYNAKQLFNKAERENRPIPGRQRVSTSKRLYEDAINKAQKVVDEHPDSKYYDDALFMIGVSYFRMTEFAKSERRFRDLLATHPESEFAEESQLYLARCRVELGDQQAAFRTFSELAQTARKKQWRAEAIFQRGEYFAATGAHDSALAAYTLILDEYGNSDRALESRLWAAEQTRLMERPLEAIPLYEPLIEDEEPLVSYEALLGTAESWYEGGYPDSGIAIFRTMAEQDEYYDSIGTIRLMLGRGLKDLGDKAGAWRQYEQVAAALELTQWSAEAYFRMAEIRQYDEGDLVSAKDLYDLCRQEDSRGELANLALARSAYIAKLTEFRKELGRGELTQRTRIGSGTPYDPNNLPGIERAVTFSPLAARPRALNINPDTLVDAVEYAAAGIVRADGLAVHGPPTPPTDELVEMEAAEALPEAAALAPEKFGPPSDLAPTLGPLISRTDIHFNRIRDGLLAPSMWWSLVGQDSLMGPPTPGYLYPFGFGRLLGPPTPSDSALEAWAELEASTPARVERERRAEERARRRTAYGDIAVSARTQLQLAELYRFDLGYTDSAVTEYDNLADQYAGTPFAAQALLGAADTYLEKHDTAAAHQHLRRVLAEYPYTDYAGDAIRLLGWQGTDADTAHPAWAYARAERAFLKEDNAYLGVERLKEFIERYPQSRLIPTAEYAVVALTDRHFPPGDSSVIWAYEEIAAEYPQTDIAGASQERLKTTIERPKRRQAPATRQQAEPELAEADSLADSTAAYARLPLAPIPKQVGLFVYPQSEIGSDLGEHVIVYKILIDFAGEISSYEVLQPSPSYDINEAANATLDLTKFWADSIPPDSLNIQYRFEMTITPPARERDEFDKYGIDPFDPSQSGKP